MKGSLLYCCKPGVSQRIALHVLPNAMIIPLYFLPSYVISISLCLCLSLSLCHSLLTLTFVMNNITNQTSNLVLNVTLFLLYAHLNMVSFLNLSGWWVGPGMFVYLFSF